jgi:hypothetical protein
MQNKNMLAARKMLSTLPGRESDSDSCAYSDEQFDPLSDSGDDDPDLACTTPDGPGVMNKEKKDVILCKKTGKMSHSMALNQPGNGPISSASLQKEKCEIEPRANPSSSDTSMRSLCETLATSSESQAAPDVCARSATTSR